MALQPGSDGEKQRANQLNFGQKTETQFKVSLKSLLNTRNVTLHYSKVTKENADG